MPPLGPSSTALGMLSGGSVTSVHSFTLTDGYHPRGSLVLHPDGHMYGTTWSGSEAVPGGGTVFAVDLATGAVTTLHAFSPLDAHSRNVDGYGSTAPLTVGPDGLLYGTTREGGVSLPLPTTPGHGILFSLSTAGVFHTLHNFGTYPRYADGANPSGSPTPDGHGNFYGATNSGVLYKWDGTAISTLHIMDDLNRTVTPATNHDGANPYGSPVFGPDGLLYGITAFGGVNGRGTVYSVDPVTGAFRVLYNFAPYVFTGNTDNAPLQQLFLASDGALYGTMEFGGLNGTGLILKVEHTVTILHQFGVYDATASPRFSNADGALPLGTPCEGLDGKMYGTTLYGGLNGTGGIWRIGKDGLGFELVYSFGSSAHDVHSPGAYPATGLTRAPDGSMYGTTFLGAGDGGGAVYHVVL